MGIKPTDPPPLYRVWVAKDRPRLVVNLYPEEVSDAANGASRRPSEARAG